MPASRWIASSAETLGAFLERANATRALADGRVFVNRRRATDPDERLVAGSVVEVFPAREANGPVRVLAVVDGLAFVDKPPGIATEPERRGASTSVLHQVAAELGVQTDELHALSRLDVGVSGVVVLGLDASARRRVQEYREQKRWLRRYVAVASGTPSPAAGIWDEPIAKRGPLRAIHASGEPATTRYRVIGSAPSASSVLALDPETGRTHQLRVHAAAHGAALYGDRSYGGPVRVISNTGAVTQLEAIALHAAWVEFPGQDRVSAELPARLTNLWADLGGAPSALRDAIECAHATHSTDFPSPRPSSE